MRTDDYAELVQPMCPKEECVNMLRHELCGHEPLHITSLEDLLLYSCKIVGKH